MGGVAGPGESPPIGVGGRGRRAQSAESVERAIRRARRLGLALPAAASLSAGAAPARATMRRSMSTNRPESGRFDQVVSAVTWNSTISPLPRGAAVTSGVPSASRAQVLPARPGSGSASTWRETVTSSGAARPKNGLSLSKGAMCFGVSHDSAPPSVRPPRRSTVGVRSSSPAASRVPAKRTSTPPNSTNCDQLVVRRARRHAHVGEHQHRRLLGEQRQDRIARSVAPSRDLGERRERAPDVIDRRQQRLGDVGARPRENGDAPALARSSISQAAPAEFSSATTRREIWLRSSTGSSKLAPAALSRAEIERRLADRAALRVERAHHAGAARIGRRRASDARSARRRDSRRRKWPSGVERSSDDGDRDGRSTPPSSARAKAPAPPSSSPSAIHTTSARGLAARKRGDRRQRRLARGRVGDRLRARAASLRCAGRRAA